MWFRITELHVSEKPQKLLGGIGLFEFLPRHCSVSPPLGSYHRQRALWLTLTQLIGDCRHKGLIPADPHMCGHSNPFQWLECRTSPASSLFAIWYLLNVYYMAGTWHMRFHIAASNFQNSESCSQRRLLKWWHLSTDNLSIWPKITKTK